MDPFSSLYLIAERTRAQQEQGRLNQRLVQAQEEALDVDADIKILESRITALEAACSGLWHLLKTKLDCTDDELLEAIRAAPVDQSAIIDAPRNLTNCPSCGRKLLMKTSPNCSWCGRAIDRRPFSKAEDPNSSKVEPDDVHGTVKETGASVDDPDIYPSNAW